VVLIPEPIQSVCERAYRQNGQRHTGWSLVGGHILERVPEGAHEIDKELLPKKMPQKMVDQGVDDIVLARLDLEETTPFSRPILERIELGRDFYVGDESGRALVRVGHGGRLHPDVELHLDSSFVFDDREEDEDLLRASYVRVLRTGDPVYVLGRAGLRCDEADASYRDSPLSVEFSLAHVIHIYDAPAFDQARAWHSLPWYRKLSVLVRNR
jgi:hypothetical protein